LDIRDPISSGGGIAALRSEVVDFAASDAPLKPSELRKFGFLAHFVDEAAGHADIGKGIAAVVEQPDACIWALMETSVLAKREGRPSPHPFCVLLDEEDSARGAAARPDRQSTGSRTNGAQT
jgi:hypothetical protein